MKEPCFILAGAIFMMASACNLKGEPGFGRARFSSDGSKIVSSFGEYGIGDIYVMNADGSEVKKMAVPKEAAATSDPCFSPDGKWILFESDPERNGHSEIWSVGADGNNLKLISKALAHL